jgi:hypothetical protein
MRVLSQSWRAFPDVSSDQKITDIVQYAHTSGKIRIFGYIGEVWCSARYEGRELEVPPIAQR